jgi:hypothetical protein
MDRIRLQPFDRRLLLAIHPSCLQRPPLPRRGTRFTRMRTTASAWPLSTLGFA